MLLFSSQLGRWSVTSRSNKFSRVQQQKQCTDANPSTFIQLPLSTGSGSVLLLALTFLDMCLPGQDMGTGATQPPDVTFLPLFLAFHLHCSDPRYELLGFPSVVHREAEKILPRSHIALSLSKGGNGARAIWFLPFACCRVRTTCKRGGFPCVYLLKIRFVQYEP